MVGQLRGKWVNIFFLIALSMMLMVACTPQNSAPIATSSPISSTATATITHTETNTPEIIPTLTPTPEPPDQISLNSPNGEFVAEFDNAHSHPALKPQIIKILDKNGSLLWKIPYQHETAMVDPHPSLSIYGWSKDSAYLYFYYLFGPDGGDFAFWWDGFDLQRINVQNGDIEQVIPGERESYVSFAFSPDGIQIAYTRAQDNPSVIYIRNVSTGAEKAAYVVFGSKNYVRVGDIRWSPSDNRLAFQTETDEGMVQTILLDTITMKQRVVREYALYTLLFDGWADNGKLQFAEMSPSGFMIGKVFQVDVATFETSEIGTATLMP